MIKNIFLFILCCFGFSIAEGAGLPILKDTVPSGVPQLFGSKYYKFNGYILADSFIMTAAGDTNAIPYFPSLEFKSSNNRWYGYDRSRWQELLFKSQQSVQWCNMVLNGADSTGNVDVSSVITAAMASGCRYIYLPKGSYLISNTVQMKDSVTIKGDGRQNTIIKLTTGIPAFKLGHANGGYKCQFLDIGFEGSATLTGGGNYSSGGDGSQTGILIDSVNGVFMQNVGGYKLGGWLVRMKKNGYCCGTYPTTAVRGNIVSNIYAQACYGGVALDTIAEYNTVDNSTFVNSLFGVFVAGGNNRVNNNNISGNTNGLYLTGGGNEGHGVAMGNTINHNTNNIYLDGVALGFTFIGNMVYASNTSQFRIINSDNVQFIGGDIVGAGIGEVTNSTNVHFTDVNMRVEPTWSITGTAPTIWRNGKVVNSVSMIDKVNNTQYDVTHVNKTVDFTLPSGSKFRFSDTTAIKTTNPAATFHVTGTSRMQGAVTITDNTDFRALPTGLLVKHFPGSHGMVLELSGGAFSIPNFVFFKNGSGGFGSLFPTFSGHQLGIINFRGVDSTPSEKTAASIRADVERCASGFLSGGVGIFTNDSSGTSRLSYFDGHGNLGLGIQNDYPVASGNPFRLHVSDGMVRFGILRGSGNILSGVDNNGIFHKVNIGSGLKLSTAGDTLKLNDSLDVVDNIEWGGVGRLSGTGSDALITATAGNMNMISQGSYSWSKSGVGSPYMSLDATGNLGIGTTPSEILHVNKNVNSGALLRFDNLNTGSSAFAGMQFQSDGGSTYIYRTSAAYGSGLGDATVLQDAGGGDIAVFGATEIARFKNNGRLGIGTTAPGDALEVANVNGSLAQGTLLRLKDNDDSNSSGIDSYRSRGTPASPTAVADGDVLSKYRAYGYDGSNYFVSGAITFSADGSHTPGLTPGRISLFTRDAAGNFNEGIRLSADNTVTIQSLANASAGVVTSTTAGVLGRITSISVANGGTGNTSLTAYALLAGGTTSTGAIQQVSGTGTTGQVLTSNGAGALPTWQDAPSFGTYTPTLTNVANITASTAYQCQYMRVGNVVTVSGKFDLDPTGSTVTVQLGISLPISSAVPNDFEIGGTGANGDVFGYVGSIGGDTTNDRAEFKMTTLTDTNNRTYFFTFTYLINNS